MKCTGCGSEMAAAARFCALCGKDRFASAPQAAVGQTMPPRTGSTVPPRPGSPYSSAPPTSNNNKVIAALLAGLAIVGIAGFLFAQAAGIFNAKPTQTSATGILNAPPTQTAPAPILNVPPTEAPNAPVMSPPQTVGNPMPEDVIAYLRWLKKYEDARRQLSARSAAIASTAFVKMQKGALDKALEMSDPAIDNPKAKPEDNFLPDLNKIVGEWNSASGIFKQRVPPNPCAPLATNYGHALDDAIAKAVKLLSLLAQIPEKAEKNPGELMQMLTDLKTENSTKSLSGQIDANFDTANASLDSLRDRYTDIPADISKAQFDIKEEGRGNVPMPTLPGFGG